MTKVNHWFANRSNTPEAGSSEARGPVFPPQIETFESVNSTKGHHDQPSQSLLQFLYGSTASKRIRYLGTRFRLFVGLRMFAKLRRRRYVVVAPFHGISQGSVSHVAPSLFSLARSDQIRRSSLKANTLISTCKRFAPMM